jgi:hypothetical protein
MNDKDTAPKSQEEAYIMRAAALLGIPTEGMYVQTIVAAILLKLAEKEAGRG